MKDMKILQQKQLDLDTFIIENNNLKGEDLFMNKVIALDVEVAEFMNNIESFKHWKKNKGKDNIIEEGIDCLHFILSLANDLNHKLKVDIPQVKDFEKGYIERQCNCEYTYIKGLIWLTLFVNRDAKALDLILESLLKILAFNKIHYVTFKNAYDTKYQINIDRQNEGY